MAFSIQKVLQGIIRHKHLCNTFSDVFRRTVTSGDSVPGSGAGRGGGGGGSIRDSGGAFGKRGHVKEEEYFRKHQSEQLKKLRKKLGDITFHEEQIKIHEEKIKSHKQIIKEIKHLEDLEAQRNGKK